MLQAAKHFILNDRVVDVVQVNALWVAIFSAVTIADLKDFAAFLSFIVGMICTVIVTVHKTKSKKNENE